MRLVVVDSLLQFIDSTFQKKQAVRHSLAIFPLTDFSCAGSSAVLHIEFETGPFPFPRDIFTAGPDTKITIQQLDGLFGLKSRRKRSEIARPIRFDPAGKIDTGIFVFYG